MSQFNITSNDRNGIEVLHLVGELDAHTAGVLEEAFKALIHQDRTRIIVNCHNLLYISSAGLGVFMAYIEDVRERKGDIKLTNMSPKVYHVFDLLGFPALYDILDDETDAIHQFTKP
jgi:anti-sigma B factor antagonist